MYLGNRLKCSLVDIHRDVRNMPVDVGVVLRLENVLCFGLIRVLHCGIIVRSVIITKVLFRICQL